MFLDTTWIKKKCVVISMGSTLFDYRVDYRVDPVLSHSFMFSDDFEPLRISWCARTHARASHFSEDIRTRSLTSELIRIFGRKKCLNALKCLYFSILENKWHFMALESTILTLGLFTVNLMNPSYRMTTLSMSLLLSQFKISKGIFFFIYDTFTANWALDITVHNFEGFTTAACVWWLAM